MRQVFFKSFKYVNDKTTTSRVNRYLAEIQQPQEITIMCVNISSPYRYDDVMMQNVTIVYEDDSSSSALINSIDIDDGNEFIKDVEGIFSTYPKLLERAADPSAWDPIGFAMVHKMIYTTVRLYDDVFKSFDAYAVCPPVIGTARKVRDIVLKNNDDPKKCNLARGLLEINNLITEFRAQEPSGNSASE